MSWLADIQKGFLDACGWSFTIFLSIAVIGNIAMGRTARELPFDFCRGPWSLCRLRGWYEP